jgi:hypothetical protein
MPCHRPRASLAFATVRSIFGRSLVVLLALAACAAPARAQPPLTAESMYAEAHARLARPEAPTMDDLIRADLLATAATRLAPAQPWGALARFELLRRWGDPTLLARQLDQLERVAPGRDMTLQAAASVKPRAPIALVAGWALLLAVCAATLVDAFRRRRLSAALLVLAAAATLLAPGVARAAFVVDEANPERTVPTQEQANASPIEFAYYLQDLADRATTATARGDQAAAIRYLRALARAVPDSSVPEVKLCAALEAHGEHDAAIAACRAALGLGGVRAQDFARFAELVLAQSQPSAAQLADVAAAAHHLAAQPDARLLGVQLECRVATRLHDLGLLDECSRSLMIAAPQDPSTWVFAWTFATERGRPEDARRYVERARAAGLPADAIARMQSAQRHAPTTPLVFAGAGLVAVGLGFMLWRRQRRAAR